MSDHDELPHWRQGAASGQPAYGGAGDAGVQQAARPLAQPVANQPLVQNGAAMGVPPHQPAPAGGQSPWGRRLGLGLLGLLAIIGLVAIGYVAARAGLGDGVITDSAEPDPAAPALGAESVDDAEADQLTVSGDDADSDEAASGDDAAAGDDGAAPDSAEGTETDEAAAGEWENDRYAIFKGGKVFLHGSVPTQEVADLIAAKAGAVVGPDNVVVEYVIDPESQVIPGDSAPLYVEDVVLFPFNSVEIAQPFYPILDLGVLLMTQNPQASITVVTHTDAVGSEEVNLEVSTKRADAVVEYWLSKGVDAGQVKTDPRGEAEATEDADDETAQLQRRAEFIITGLLD